MCARADTGLRPPLPSALVNVKLERDGPATQSRSVTDGLGEDEADSHARDPVGHAPRAQQGSSAVSSGPQPAEGPDPGREARVGNAAEPAAAERPVPADPPGDLARGPGSVLDPLFVDPSLQPLLGVGILSLSAFGAALVVLALGDRNPMAMLALALLTGLTCFAIDTERRRGAGLRVPLLIAVLWGTSVLLGVLYMSFFPS